MEIIPRVYYVANLFNFVSNLACWHFSCRKSYGQFWLQQTGPLTPKESKSLKKASSLFKKYGFGDKYWGKVFLSHNDDVVWDTAKDFFGDESSSFQEVFRVFKPRFDKIWETDKVLLAKWVDQFEKYRTRLSPENLIDCLDVFFDQDESRSSVEVVFLMNIPSNSAYGGGNLGTGHITLELSRTPIEYFRPASLVMWHEIVHGVWQTDKYRKLLRNFIKTVDVVLPLGEISIEGLINEAVTESLFPHGYLAQKYFGFPSKDYFDKELSSKNIQDKISCWRNFSAYKLFPLAKHYVETKKHLDANFLEEVVQYLKQFYTS